MSYGESPSMTCPAENTGVGEMTEDSRDVSDDKNSQCVSNGRSSCDSSVRERVLKEVGLTSATFIGPALPPETGAVKSDIDETLSEFYKELQKIDTPEGEHGNPGKQDEGFVQPKTPPKISNSKETHEVSQERTGIISKSEETDGYQKSNRQKQPSWPHWYQNEPYYNRKPRPHLELGSGRVPYSQNQWNSTQPPNPRLHRPPFHPPPPPAAIHHPQNAQLHMNPKWNESGMSTQYQESHFPTFSSFPAPNMHSHPSQGLYGDSEYPLDRDERHCSYNSQSENINVGWPTARQQEWSPFSEDYDWRQKFDSENEQLEQHHCRPRDNSSTYHYSLVLILMRGLPGSGKTTLARELLATGASGLILSTDDYFAHKDGYCYEPGLIGEAHEWNQNRAKDAMQDCRSPIIIDNTNIQAWEMKPYVQMALERGYKVDFCEPDTRWKFDPYELEKRNKHRVPKEKIAQMLDRFSFPISIDIVMSSQEPPHVDQRRRPDQRQMMGNPNFH